MITSDNRRGYWQAANYAEGNHPTAVCGHRHKTEQAAQQCADIQTDYGYWVAVFVPGCDDCGKLNGAHPRYSPRRGAVLCDRCWRLSLSETGY